MTKSTAIKRTILVVILLALGMLLTFGSFGFKFNGTDYIYHGFLNSIKLGLDLKGGVLAVYEASSLDGESDSNLDEKVAATKTRLQDTLSRSGYTEALVSTTGNRIRIEVPDVDNPDEIFNLLGRPASLEIRKTEDGEAVLTGKHIKNASATYQDNKYGVVVEFTPEGSTLFYQLTSELVGQSTYIYINGELFSSPTVESAISGGSTFISGSMADLNEAKEYATMILSGTFSVNLTLLENSAVSATLGQDALLWSMVAGIIGLLLIFIFMIVVYGAFGVIADIALLFYFILMMFFLQAIPLVQLTLPGIAGIILSLGMALDGNIIMFERIKDEYRSGKRIPAAVDGGFKKSLGSIIDANLTTLIVAVVLAIFGTGPIQGLAVTLIIGILLALFTNIVVSRGLIRTYLAFNHNKPKLYKLRREVDTSELA